MELHNVLNLNGYTARRDLATIKVRTIGLYSAGSLVAVNVALIGTGFKWHDIGMYTESVMDYIDNEKQLLEEINDLIDKAYRDSIKAEYELYMLVQENSSK